VSWDITNEATVRLASGTRDRLVQLWTFNGKDLQSIFSIKLTETVPRAIGFADNASADLYVIGMYAGSWYVFPARLPIHN
jgi:hypothetical protein